MTNQSEAPRPQGGASKKPVEGDCIPLAPAPHSSPSTGRGILRGGIHKSAAIYARVSTDKQKVDMQLNELREFVARSGWTIYNEYIDHSFTGTNTNRPAFLDMMEAARKRKFDVLVVWKLDRLSRSLKDLINTLDELGSMIHHQEK
jgi:hypothetical protein